MSKPKTENLIASNKRAGREYEILDTVEAGLVLTGSEVKSLRAGKVSFHDPHVKFRRGEAFLLGVRIAPYENAGYSQHEPDREKKLLLHGREIELLKGEVERKGLTIIPLRLYFSHGKAKILVAVGRGKKLHDRREDLKEAAVKREMERVR